MNKLIIDNRTEKSDEEALRIARIIVQKGRISSEGNGKSYCAVAVNPEKNIQVACWRNKDSDTIRIAYDS